MSVTIIVPPADAFLNEIPTWEQAKLLGLVNGNFIPPGAGAATRLVNTKLAEISVSPADYGSVIDIDDTASIQRAIAAVQATGGVVDMVPLGRAYLTSDSLIVPNGVTLKGRPCNFNYSDTATLDQWASAGTWIRPSHATNSAVILSGHGASIIDIAFQHVQDTPAVTWTPRTYGWCVDAYTFFSRIENIVILNADKGIILRGTPGSGGGTHCRVANCIIGAFGTAFQTSFVNDTIHLSNIHVRGLWYMTNALVSAYQLANLIGIRWGYTDNPMGDGIEMFNCAVGMLFDQETVTVGGNNTKHGFFNGTLVNVHSNLCKVAMQAAAADTVISGSITNFLAQSGNSFGATWSDTLLQLGSDNVDLHFVNARIPQVGGKMLDLGAGAGGEVSFSGLKLASYSTVLAGQVALNVAANAKVRLANYRIVKTAGAGARFGGAGVVTTDAQGVVMYLGRNAEASIVGNASFQDLSLDCQLRPGSSRIHWIRLIGTLNVTVAGGGSFSARLAGGIASGPTVAGLSSAGTGAVSVDSGVVDVSEADISANGFLGRLQANPGVGTTITNGTLQLLYG